MRRSSRVAARSTSPSSNRVEDKPTSTHPHASWAQKDGFSKYITASIAACRPKSLTAAVVPFAVGTALSFTESDGSLNRWHHALPAFAGYILMQIGCNLVNDSCDFTRGADTNNRTGPVRVSQAGVFKASTVHKVGVACLLLAFIAMLPAGLQLEWIGNEVDMTNCPVAFEVNYPIIVLTVLSCLAAYLYTGGPYPLGYHGLGDVTVVLFFGIVATGLMRATLLGMDGVGAVSHLNSFRNLFTHRVLLSGIQTGCLATVLLAVNNLRDVKTDKRARKKTLAVIYGADFVKREIYFLLAVAYVFSLAWCVRVNTAARSGAWVTLVPSYVNILPLATLPLALNIVRRVRKVQPGDRKCNEILATAALCHLCFGGLLALGIWLDKAHGDERR